MKILQIASIFPVKDAPEENPYVRKYVQYYSKKYHDDFTILKPESSLPWVFIPVSDKPGFFWLKKRKICRQGYYYENSLSIFVLPYFSIGTISFLHSMFSSVIWHLNKYRLKELAGNFDLLHAHYLFPDGILAYQLHKKTGIPYVLTLQQELRFLENKTSLKWVERIIRNASVITTLSPQMQNGLQEKGFENIQLIPIGIENWFFMKDFQISLDSKKSSKLKLISVCNLIPVKNLFSVLHAISKLPQKEKIDYTIYGRGPEENNLKELVDKLQLKNQVHFRGPIENKKLMEIFPKFDVFIQPSFKETFGLSYFEALVCGLPVIFTENTGAYEIIKDKDVYYLVDPYKPETIKSCIEEIMNDRETLARKASQAPEAAKIASWGKFVDYFHEQYNKINV